MTTLKKKPSDRVFHAEGTDVNSNNVISSKSSSPGKPPSTDIKAESRSTGDQSGDQSGDIFLWVDKYKPQSTNKIIGQQGEKCNAKKLLHWLKSWHKNRAAGTKPAGIFFFVADSHNINF